LNNNEAFVGRIGIVNPIEGADNIMTATVELKGVPITVVIVGKETKTGDKIVYFDSNLCLEQSVIDDIDKLSPNYGNKDFKSLGNYLAKGNRVRCIKLRGEISNGLIIPAEKFSQYFKSANSAKVFMEDGFSFTKLGDTEICHKYVPVVKAHNPGTGKKGRRGKVESRMIPEQFAFHIDTEQLLRNLHKLDSNSIISISHKWHGTSAICGNVLVKRKLNILEKVSKLLGVKVIDTEYDYIYASRSVVKNSALTTGFYSEDLWSNVGKENFLGKLHQGETVYYEIVGYLSSGSFIQKHYDYGCKPTEHKIVVYRITKTGPDGNVVEYSWNKVKERCIELNVPMVTEYYHGKACDMYRDILINEDWRLNFVNRLKQDYLEKDLACNLTKKVPDEGIVLRVDNGGIEVYKMKSDKFFVHETKMAEDEAENVEDSQEGE